MSDEVKEVIKPKLGRQEVEGQIATARNAIAKKQEEIDQAVRTVEQYKGIVLYCEHLLKDYDLV